MANFICPFSKKVCNPSCEHWVFEKSNTNSLMGIIPVSLNTNDIISGILNFTKLPMPVAYVLGEYKKYYELYHPENTNAPRGRCLRVEKLNEENNLTEDNN